MAVHIEDQRVRIAAFDWLAARMELHACPARARALQPTLASRESGIAGAGTDSNTSCQASSLTGVQERPNAPVG
jgi:hypothetical protein